MPLFLKKLSKTNKILFSQVRRVRSRFQGDQRLDEAQEEAAHGRIPLLQVPLPDRQVREEIQEGGRVEASHAASRRREAVQM